VMVFWLAVTIVTVLHSGEKRAKWLCSGTASAVATNALLYTGKEEEESSGMESVALP
jgi:hypothetical protein